MSILNLPFLKRINQNVGNPFNSKTFPHGKNLFNKNNYIDSSYINSIGNEASNASYRISSYIPVIASSKIIINKPLDNSNIHTGFYNNGTLISLLGNDELSLNGGIFSIPNNVDSMRISYQVKDSDTLQIEYGDVSTSLEEFDPIPKQLSFLEKQNVITSPNLNSHSPINYPHGKNLFNKDNYVAGFYIESEGQEQSDGVYNSSDHIKVLPNYNIKINNVYNNPLIYTAFYLNGEFVSSISNDVLVANGKTLKVPSNVDTMRISIHNTDILTTQVEYGSVSTSYENYTSKKTQPNFLETQNVRLAPLREDFRETEKYIFGQLDADNGLTLYAVRENDIIYATDTVLYYSSNGINDGFSLTVNESTDSVLITDLIDAPVGATIIGCKLISTPTGIRSLILTTGNGIWYSDGQVFGNFKKSDIWALEGDEYKHPSIGTSDKDPSGLRYRYYQPINKADRATQFHWFDGGIFIPHEGDSSGWREGFCFGNYQLGEEEEAVPSCVFYTEDGKNIYVEYMFGIKGSKVKQAGTTTYHNQPLEYGDLLNTSTFTNDYVSGLTLKTRINIVPSSLDLDQTILFELGNDRTITTFSKATPSIATVNDATDIEIGSTVLIGGDSSDSEWNDLRNTAASASIGGNGRIYTVIAISGNNLTLAESIGNPNNNLVCRHIHGVNEFANGVAIVSGERYPQGWIVFMRTDPDPTNVNWEAITILNPSEKAISRGIGIHLRTDNKLLFASDEQNFTVESEVIQIRGVKQNIASKGLWIGNLSDIDVWGKFSNKLWNITPVFKFAKLAPLTLFVSTYTGQTFISFDDGNTFEHIVTDGRWKRRTLGSDKKGNRFFFSSELFIDLK